MQVWPTAWGLATKLLTISLIARNVPHAIVLPPLPISPPLATPPAGNWQQTFGIYLAYFYIYCAYHCRCVGECKDSRLEDRVL